jgi:hypothetical protein
MSRALPRYTQEPAPTLVSHRKRRPLIDDTPDPTPGTKLHYPNPQDLRGIPCIAPGVGGTQPGTSPHHMAGSGRLDPRRRPTDEV